MLRLIFSAVLLTTLLALTKAAGRAEAPAVPPSTPTPVEVQLRELREEQQAILQELREIKTLLQTQTTRRDTPAQAQSLPWVNVTGEPFKGSATARVAILEYSDFECAFCADYATNTFPKLDATYVRTGKVKYYFRDLPLPTHPFALAKAQIARSAADQGRFWEAHDLLFRDQRPLIGDALSEFARNAGLDFTRLTNAISMDHHLQNIRRSITSASRMGIQGTPAFLIGPLTEDGNTLKTARMLTGAESQEIFRALLDELLGSAPGPVPTPAQP